MIYYTARIQRGVAVWCRRIDVTLSLGDGRRPILLVLHYIPCLHRASARVVGCPFCSAMPRGILCFLVS